MNPRDPNVALVEIVVSRLDRLCEELVFVGGCATGLLVTDLARPPVRATKDVDLVAEVTSVTSYYALHSELKARGFAEDKKVNCRWRLGDLKVDIMPLDPKILGFTNRWYPQAVMEAMPYRLPSGSAIRLVPPAVFIATKLEAFYGRGKGDYGVSHDMEDIITVIDGRPELLTEIASADSELRQYLADEIEDLLGNPSFTDTLGYHFAGDAANQARVPEVLRRLRAIAGI
jgi:predicted nucleotidyltransferase